MALSELTSVLGDCTRILASPSAAERPAAAELAPRFQVAALAAMAEWDIATEEARAEVRSRMLEFAGMLAELPATALEGADAFMAGQRHELALQVVTHCSNLATLPDWPGSGSDVFRWARCASHILTSGTMTLHRWLEGAAAAGSISGSGTAAGLALAVARSLAKQQATAMQALLALLSTQPDQQRTLAAWAGNVARPVQLLRWLELMARVVCVAHEAGLAMDAMLKSFIGVASTLLQGEAFQRHQAALRAAPQQQEQVAALFLPLYHVAAQQAAELGSDSGDSGSASGGGSSGSSSSPALLLAIRFFDLLRTDCLREGMLAQLQGRRGTELVDAAAGLVVLMSRLPLAAEMEASVVVASTMCWVEICNAIISKPTRGGGFSDVQRQAIWQVAQQLPAQARIASKVHAAAQTWRSLAEHESQIRGCSGALLGIRVATTLFEHDGLAEEVLAREARDRGTLGSAFAGTVQAAAAAARFAGIAPKETIQALASCLQAASALLPSSIQQLPAGEAEKRQLVMELRSVHSTTCRLAHHWLGEESMLPMDASVLSVLSDSFLASESISCMCEEAQFPSRELQASAVVHVKAAALLAIHCDLSAKTACKAAVALTRAVALCNPWLGAHEFADTFVDIVQKAVPAADRFSSAVDSGPPGRPSYEEPFRHLVLGLIATAASVPQMATALVSKGVLGELVEGFLRTEPQRQLEERAQEVQRFRSQAVDVNKNLLQLVSALGRAVQDAMAADVAAGADVSNSPAGQLPAGVMAAAAQMVAAPVQLPEDAHAAGTAVRAALARLLPVAARLAGALQEHWKQPEQRKAAELELARVAATRGCANLQCANLGAQGGPDRGQVPGSMRCGGCRVVRYCCTDCQAADWRAGGHRKVCAALKALREEAAGAAGGREGAQEPRQQQ